MHRIFYPESVLVIGVSSKPDNLGKNIVANLLEFGYRGEIYALGRERDEVYGITVHDSFDTLPDGIDLAVILVPAPLVPKLMDECGRKGIRRVIIESGGFSEFSEKGKSLEQQVLDVARRWGIRFVGPNCISIVNMDNGLCLPFVQIKRDAARKGPVSVLAQSGGVAVTYFNLLSSTGLGFNKIVSMGNKLDLDEIDYLDYLMEDEGTKVICLYLESIERGRELVERVRSASKPVILQKANLYRSTSEIALSHTAALANDDRIVNAAVKQAGILRADNFREAVNYAKVLLLPRCRGRRLAVLSRSGGHAVIAADAAARYGFILPGFSKSFLESVVQLFRAKVIRPTNPLDLGDLFDFDVYVKLVEECLRLPEFDAVMLIHSYSSYTEREDSHRLVRRVRYLAERYEKPVLLCLFSEGKEIDYVERTLGYPVFTEIDEPLRALDGVISSYERRRVQEGPLEVGIDVSKACSLVRGASGEGRVMSLSEALDVLRGCGIPVVEGAVALSEDEACRLADAIGYPVALKLVSPDVLHKTDVGGVVLGIADEDELRSAWRNMLESVVSKVPGVKVEGVLVQRMVEGGREVIIGGKRDPSFGPVVMFGLGGIYVEVLGEVSFRLAPLSRDEARGMVQELRGSRILAGVRGEPPSDLEAVVDAIVRLGQLMAEVPGIAEVDVNPFIVFPEGGMAVDARVVLR